MILEIHQLIWLETPKGQGIAKFLIDNGPESDLQWVCFITATREIWTFSNWNVRVSKNETLGRTAEISDEDMKRIELDEQIRQANSQINSYPDGNFRYAGKY